MENPIEMIKQCKLLKLIVYSAEWTIISFGSSPNDIYSLDVPLQPWVLL